MGLAGVAACESAAFADACFETGAPDADAEPDGAGLAPGKIPPPKSCRQSGAGVDGAADVLAGVDAAVFAAAVLFTAAETWFLNRLLALARVDLGVLCAGLACDKAPGPWTGADIG